VLFYERRPIIKPFSLYSTLSFFVVAGTVKPLLVSPVELVDYLMLKTIYSFLFRPPYPPRAEKADGSRWLLYGKYFSAYKNLSKYKVNFQD